MAPTPHPSTDLLQQLAHAPAYPQRVVCLTEETTETLYRLGCGDRVVGVSCFTLRPAAAREKPRVSSFLDAKFDELMALKPDLVLGFSDLQADIAKELIRRGVAVYVFNQRSVAEVLQAVRLIGSLVGEAAAAQAQAVSLSENLHRVGAQAARLSRRPRVFFEEWPDPVISAIRWVSELIEIAGGEEICAASRARHDAQGRIFSVDDVIARDPEVIIASWCGKRARKQEIQQRYATTTAVKNDQIYEIESELILQPGPAALTDGVNALHAIIAAVAAGRALPPSPDGLRRAPTAQETWAHVEVTS